MRLIVVVCVVGWFLMGLFIENKLMYWWVMFKKLVMMFNCVEFGFMLCYLFCELEEKWVEEFDEVCGVLVM